MDTSNGPKAKRRSFLQYALTGGVSAGLANLTIMKDAFAQAPAGPIVIGHHCELTGGFASWGYWHDKAARKAVDIINKNGGIANRKVELATEDTESNPTSGVRKLRNLIQRANAEFVMGSVHSGVMLASIPIATELKTIYMSMGEATEATGSKGTRYSFRTGMDTYSIAAAGVPWCMENLGKNWTVVYADYAWGQSHFQETKALVEKLGGKVVGNIPVPLDAKDFVPYLTQIPGETQVVFSIFFGSLSVAFYTQAKSMGVSNKFKMYSKRSPRPTLKARLRASISLRTFRAYLNTRTTLPTGNTTGSWKSTTLTRAKSTASASWPRVMPGNRGKTCSLSRRPSKPQATRRARTPKG